MQQTMFRLLFFFLHDSCRYFTSANVARSTTEKNDENYDFFFKSERDTDSEVASNQTSACSIRSPGRETRI